MKQRPTTYIRRAMKRARRRRIGYAALRDLRRGLVRAIDAHLLRSIGPAPYASQWEEIYALYRRGLAELLRRYPGARLDDERGQP